MATVADVLVRRLREWGVRRIFGYPGDAIRKEGDGTAPGGWPTASAAASRSGSAWGRRAPRLAEGLRASMEKGGRA